MAAKAKPLFRADDVEHLKLRLNRLPCAFIHMAKKAFSQIHYGEQLKLDRSS